MNGDKESVWLTPPQWRINSSRKEKMKSLVAARHSILSKLSQLDFVLDSNVNVQVLYIDHIASTLFIFQLTDRVTSFTELPLRICATSFKVLVYGPC